MTRVDPSMTMSYIARMKKDERFSLRLPADLKDELQRRADAESRSLAAYMVLVLQAHVGARPPDVPSPTFQRAAARSKAKR
jgi:hypothetical protein